MWPGQAVQPACACVTKKLKSFGNESLDHFNERTATRMRGRGPMSVPGPSRPCLKNSCPRCPESAQPRTDANDPTPTSRCFFRASRLSHLCNRPDLVSLEEDVVTIWLSLQVGPADSELKSSSPVFALGDYVIVGLSVSRTDVCGWSRDDHISKQAQAVSVLKSAL